MKEYIQGGTYLIPVGPFLSNSNGITPAKWNGVDWSNLKWNGM